MMESIKGSLSLAQLTLNNNAGDAIKFNFPQSFAVIKWGADSFFNTFNSTADTIIDRIACSGTTSLYYLFF